jgi:hypothetical protein
MGRRYGRNQKRRHREKIAELDAIQKRLLRHNTSLLNETVALKAELKTLVEEIDAITPLSALFKPTTKSLDPDQLMAMPFEFLERPEDRGFETEIRDIGAVAFRRVQMNLYGIVGEVRSNPTKFKKAIHLIARSPKDKRRAVYYVSEDALDRGRDLHHVFEHIFQALIRDVVQKVIRA